MTLGIKFVNKNKSVHKAKKWLRIVTLIDFNGTSTGFL